MEDEKKYKEALKKLQEALAPKDGREISGLTRSCIEEIFPELKESEDEKIRKELIEHIKANKWADYVLFQKFSPDDVIAWLEKQDNKPVNIDIESMVSSYKQRLESQGNGSMRNNPLVNMCLTAFKHGVEEVLQELNLKEFEKPQGESESERIKKAVKAIKEEKFDNANKVEPKFKVGEWIVWQNKYCKVNYNGCGYELVDQNGLSTSLEYGTVDGNAHLWDITKDAKDGDVLVSNYGKPFIYNGNHNSIRVGAYCGISTENRFNVATEKCRWTTNVNIRPANKEQHNALMKAMTDAGWTFDFEKKELKIEQSSAWSEDDGKMLDSIIEEVRYIGDFPDYPTEEENELYDECLAKVNWLKSLKDRIQPHWKPSDEQIKALEHFVRGIGESGYVFPYDANLKLVHSLLNDLKKLK